MIAVDPNVEFGMDGCVILINNKCDISNLDNYRPVSQENDHNRKTGTYNRPIVTHETSRLLSRTQNSWPHTHSSKPSWINKRHSKEIWVVFNFPKIGINIRYPVIIVNTYLLLRKNCLFEFSVTYIQWPEKRSILTAKTWWWKITCLLIFHTIK